MIISFYSYKGGVGRTQLLVNIASYLCFFENKKILVIDWDLEAPGLHYFFNKENIKSKGVIDIFTEFVEIMKPFNELDENKLPIFDNSCIVKNVSNTPANKGQIDLVTAGNFDTDYKEYSSRVNTFNWVEFYNKFDGATYIEILKKSLKDLNYDYVFIDSRTGISDYSGIVNIQFPDVNVLVVAPTKQNFIGNLRVANNIKNSLYVEKEYRKPVIMPIFSRVDISVEEKTGSWNKYFKDTFEYFIEEFCKYTNNLVNDYLDNILLDYKRDLSFGEQILFNSKTKEISEKSLAKQYKQIAKYILNINIEKNFTGNSNSKALNRNFNNIEDNFKQNTNYIFPFGSSNVGKSTVLAMLAHTIKHKPDLVLKANLSDKKGFKYLFKNWLESIENKNFPIKSKQGELLNIDVGFEIIGQDEATFNFTFFEISGEDFNFFDIINESDQENTISNSILNALDNSRIIMLISEPNTVHEDDNKIFQFLLRTESMGLNVPIVLIAAKWDIISDNEKYENAESFAKLNLPNTTAYLKSKKHKTNIAYFPFSVGSVDENNNITNINTKYASEILDWMFLKGLD